MIALPLALQFSLELAALASFGYWGVSTGDPTWVHVLLAIAAPSAAAVVCGTFGSPKAPLHLRAFSGFYSRSSSSVRPRPRWRRRAR
jgi:hypothetical protein